MKDKTVIITGTSGGLGKAMVLLAAKKKMKIILSDINPSPSEKLAGDINQNGGRAIFVRADLARPEERGSIIDTGMRQYGRIDYLFNNAGYIYFAKVEDLELDKAHRLFEVNFWAYADLAIKTVPIMKKQGGGAIINICSLCGLGMAESFNFGIYKASKHAVAGLFESMSFELKKYNISVKIMCPSVINTDILSNSVGPEKVAVSALPAKAWGVVISPEDAAEEIFNNLNKRKTVIRISGKNRLYRCLFCRRRNGKGNDGS